MTLNILYLAENEDWTGFRHGIPAALAARGIDARIARDIPADEADYIVYAPDHSDKIDFSAFNRARAVLSLWAGVERVVKNPTLIQPLARMADAGLREGMVEWVTGHVLRHHLGMDAHILGQDGVWRGENRPPLAFDRTVAILGLGALGAACGLALARLNFKVLGWARRAREIEGMTCFSGDAGLRAALEKAAIVVLLLPLTRQTENILDAERLALMPSGSFVINPGRGPLIDDSALLGALDSGQIAHATLDVFRTEPLPPDHPYWAHPRVTVTPHIASATRTDTACEFVAENIVRAETGQPLIAEVDRGAGY